MLVEFVFEPLDVEAFEFVLFDVELFTFELEPLVEVPDDVEEEPPVVMPFFEFVAFDLFVVVVDPAEIGRAHV